MRPAPLLALAAWAASGGVVGACGGGGERAAAATAPGSAEELLAPVVAVRFGGPIEDLRRARPRLEPSGWRGAGAAETWIDVTLEAGLEVETVAGRVRAVTVTFEDARADGVERDVSARLGAGVACSALPEGLAGYRPLLWRTPDGGGVSLMRKQRTVLLRVEKPATPAFDAAWSSCGAEVSR